MKKYVKEDLSYYDTLLEQGEITLEEYITQQLTKLRVPQQDMIDELDLVASIRPYFPDLIDYCGVNDAPFTVVSAGLDFVIRHFLTRARVEDRVEICAPQTRFTEQTIQITFPPLKDETSLDFKQDLVKDYQRHGYTVFYIGDALSDYNAVRQAKYSFAIQGSNLDQLCKREKIPYQIINNFKDVIDALDAMKLTS